MSFRQEIFNSTIVVLGPFSPGVFTPDWLENSKLIGATDAEHARTSKDFVVSNEVTNIVSESFRLQVTQDRLLVENVGVLTPAVRDLVSGILRLHDKLPIRAVGLNFLAHFKIDNIDDYHRVGDAFAPKKIWETVFTEKPLSFGMTDVAMRIAPFERGDLVTHEDEQRVTIQPSTRISNGVFTSINNHYSFSSVDAISKATPSKSTPSKSSSDWACTLIDSKWEPAWDEASQKFEALLRAALES